MNPSYRYSNSFVAQPALWTPSVAPQAQMLAEARVHQVAQPAAKVMFWDVERAYDARWLRSEIADEDAKTPMLFADGHADVKRIRDAAEAVRNPLNQRESDATMKLNNTPRGVRGRDY